MTFVKRHIKLKFQLGEGAFGADGHDTVEFEGLRVAATISRVGGNTMPTADIRAFGMPLDTMNRLSILGKPLASVRANSVTLSVYDEGETPVDLFTGTIKEAWIDARNSPEVSFPISAFTGLMDAMKPAAATSYKGPVDLAVAASNIAQNMGLAFENNSKLSVIVNDHHLSGTLRDQIVDVAKAGNFNFSTDQGVLAIWPLDGDRSNNPPEISALTGLVGYPAISDAGVEFVSLFNPLVTVGYTINLKSAFERANGRWTLMQVVHELESETPGGRWFTTMSGRIFGHTAQ